LNRHGHAAVGLDLPHHLIGGKRVRSVINSHGITFFAGQQRCGSANPAAAAGNQ
jgi:hypothetical protein